MKQPIIKFFLFLICTQIFANPNNVICSKVNSMRNLVANYRCPDHDVVLARSLTRNFINNPYILSEVCKASDNNRCYDGPDSLMYAAKGLVNIIYDPSPAKEVCKYLAPSNQNQLLYGFNTYLNKRC